jgi:hypothetical protein
MSARFVARRYAVLLLSVVILGLFLLYSLPLLPYWLLCLECELRQWRVTEEAILRAGSTKASLDHCIREMDLDIGKGSVCKAAVLRSPHRNYILGVVNKLYTSPASRGNPRWRLVACEVLWRKTGDVQWLEELSRELTNSALSLTRSDEQMRAYALSIVRSFPSFDEAMADTPELRVIRRVAGFPEESPGTNPPTTDGLSGKQD